jgi:hypothetical protein
LSIATQQYIILKTCKLTLKNLSSPNNILHIPITLGDKLMT